MRERGTVGRTEKKSSVLGNLVAAAIGVGLALAAALILLGKPDWM